MRTPLLSLVLVALASGSHREPAPEAFQVRDVRLDLTIDHAAERLSGTFLCELENWTGAPAGEVSFLLNRLMEASAVEDGGGAALRYTQDVVRFTDEPMRQVTRIRVRLARPVPAGGRTTVRIAYAGNLVGYTEIGWLYVRDRIDTAFTILREDALAFPSIGGVSDAANRKRPRGEFTYDASIRVPGRYLVAAGGALTRAPHPDGTVTWRYLSGRPAPFLNVSVAPFDTLVEGGVRLFHFPADSEGARRTMANTQAALRLLARWFGPRHDALNLTITEIPDGWGSQASAVAGIIQTASAFREPGRSGELYHELSHLWNAKDTDTPSPRWNEGLAMFLQFLLRERVEAWPGRREAETWYFSSIRSRVPGDSLLRTVPMIDYGRRNMTGNSYSVAEVMFAALFDLVGEERFDSIVGGYYQQHAAAGTTREFVAFAGRAAGRNLDPFFDDWIYTTRWTDLIGRAASPGDLAAHYRGAPP